MPDASLIDQIAERAERLLVRHDELMRTNTILREQVAALTHERDSLKSRLLAARARVDALIERLPANQNPAGPDDAPYQPEEGTP
jgi:uncharacterized protein (TIGR02449 family)